MPDENENLDNQEVEEEIKAGEEEKEKEEEKKEEKDVNPDEVDVETRLREEEVGEEEKEKEENEENEVDPEDKKTINRLVDRRVGRATQGIRDQVEVDAFIRSKPEYSNYRKVALKYLAHPSYKNIPVHNVMAIVAAKDQQKIGAEKEREAAKKTSDSREPSGSSARKPLGGSIDWSRASAEEVEVQRNKILGRNV